MFLLMDTMTCRFKILIHCMKVDIKDDHKLEDTIDQKKNFQGMKHGMKITCLNRDIANELELYPYATYKDIGVVPKSQASTYKSWPKKEDKPKMAFKDHSKPKVEEKGRLITNPTRCFKCNRVGHIAINCPTKRTFVFSEDLNGWIEKNDDDCKEVLHLYLHYKTLRRFLR
ncbi:hypothetical protein M9H77_30845 [Catharanthus roseus]|uniref:Uncharacterized protein n=1 Tax=Catharanthus roseus TaxID=4058 RepID=A0ACC0A0P5_CATRO|nr:hypothetical protein M9H77_30845 [Catharanthus roseus]